MIVRVARDSAVVEESDDLGRLHVASVLSTADTDAGLRAAGLGRLDPEGRALLDIGALEAAAAPDTTAWRAMLDYAATKGWTQDDGAIVIAHVERG